jgi:hypothetical protein
VVVIFLILQFLEKTNEFSRQYTIIFNTYVLMQLFNEVNCRKLEGEHNVFEGITNNKYFLRIWLTTLVLQVIFAQFGGPIIGCSSKGLTAGQWSFCIGVSAGTIVWQQIINVVANKTMSWGASGNGGGVLKFGKGKVRTGLETKLDAANRSQSMRINMSRRG